MALRRSTDAEALRLLVLVIRCQAGDERAFRQLFDSFAPRTLGYLRGLIGDAAEDVHQELWLAVYRGIASLSNPRGFRTWLFRATRHRAIDYLRRVKRESELMVDVPLDAVNATDEDREGDDRADIDTTIAGAAVESLPPPQREVVLLRYEHDMSYAEIALVVGVPIGTVRTRLHHAKRKLQELINRGD